MLIDILHGRKPTHCTIPEALSAQLPSLVNLLRKLGELAYGEQRSSAPSCALEADNLSELLVEGVEALSQLPQSFESLLDRIAKPELGPRMGVREPVYGRRLLRFIQSDDPFLDVLRPIFNQHSEKRAASFRGDTPKPPTHHQKTRENKAILLTDREMQRLRSAVAWVGSTPAQRGEVLAAERRSGGVLNKKEAAAYLGMACPIFTSFFTAGAVQPCWHNEGARELHFYRSELDVVLRRLTHGAPTFATVPTHLSTLHATSHRVRIGFSDLLIAILKGELACGGLLEGAVGANAILLPNGSIARATTPRPSPLLSEVRSILNLQVRGWQAVRDGGLLSVTATHAASSPGWDDIEAFDNEFLSLGRIAKALGTHNVQVRRRLEIDGVMRALDDNRVAIFRRSDVEKVFGSTAVPKISRGAT